jgi:hypothetical protein
MIVITKGLFSKKLDEMATSCHPKDNGGKYPMWIRVEYTNGEHEPPHAHLYRPEGKPSKKNLITKFLILKNAPQSPSDIQVMRGKPPVPSEYAKMIIQWAKDTNELGLNNWLGLQNDWLGLEKTLR